MEYLNVYDENKNKLSRRILRGEKLNENEHILLSIIIIQNESDEYLIQKTSKEKGSVYATTGGHVLYDETSKDAIMREVKEELGIDISNDEIVFVDSIILGTPIFDVYYLKKNIDLNDVVMQKEEVSDIMYMSKDKVLNLIEADEFKKSHGIIFKEFLSSEYKL